MDRTPGSTMRLLMSNVNRFSTKGEALSCLNTQNLSQTRVQCAEGVEERPLS